MIDFMKETFSYVIEPSKHSTKKNGLIKAYAANTHNGLFRNYNEDRVSIILSISKPSSKNVEKWPKCSFFAVYDGHGIFFRVKNRGKRVRGFFEG